MTPQLRRILVTGGAGFIGSHVVEMYEADGWDVTVVDDLSTGVRSNLANAHGRIDLLEGDIGEALRTRRIDVSRFDLVVHLAANSYVPWSVEDPRRDFALNIGNSFELLEAIRAAEPKPRLVNISSAAVYGDPDKQPMKEADPTFPISPYGVSKLAAERYVAVYSRLYGLRAASLRLFSVFGPRQRKQVVFDLIGKCRDNPNRIAVHGDGTQERDFVFVTDVVEAIRVVADRAPAKGEVYNVASGTTVSLAHLLSSVCRACKVQPEIAYSGSVRPGDAQRWYPDITALRAIGFAPATHLDAGVGAVRVWYDTNHAAGSDLAAPGTPARK